MEKSVHVDCFPTILGCSTQKQVSTLLYTYNIFCSESDNYVLDTEGIEFISKKNFYEFLLAKTRQVLRGNDNFLLRSSTNWDSSRLALFSSFFREISSTFFLSEK